MVRYYFSFDEDIQTFVRFTNNQYPVEFNILGDKFAVMDINFYEAGEIILTFRDNN